MDESAPRDVRRVLRLHMNEQFTQMYGPPPVVGMVGERLVPLTDEAEWAAVSPREITPEEWQRFEGYMREIFGALGLAVGSEATVDTPRRFLRAIFDATSGYEGDEKLVTAFQTECRGGSDCRISQIVEGPIPFFALCEHHGLPFFGKAYIGYIAHEHILGLSKLTRLVRLFARRFSMQERIGRQLAESLQQILLPHGVAVHLEAVHLCTQMRGVREIESSTRTTHWRGTYDEDPQLRGEFFTLCGQRGLAGHG
ncbi:GTP cyclohydrolase I [Streptomyces sp. NBC_01707]|uniref:GTP cyclohydrolase I n=1 Tax=Streptomyces sp. NBC_01707 TaxID=2975914 RepID=UPI00352F24F0